MKIAYVVPSLSKKWGGTTTSVLSFFNQLSSNNMEIHLLCIYLKDELKDIEQNILNQRNLFLFESKDKYWRYSTDLKNYLDSNINNYNLVHIHGLWLYHSYIASRLCIKKGIPYVISPHGMLEENALAIKSLKKKIYINMLERKTLKNSSGIHCITSQEEINVQSIIKINSIVIPNGVKYKDFYEKNYENLDYFTFIGRLHPIKGLDKLIYAFSKMEISLKLYILGSGNKQYEDYLKELVESLNMESRIKFIGFVNEKERDNYLMKSKFTIVPSFSEVLSMVALESMNNSTPVIVTKDCNFSDVEDFDTGLIINSNTEDDIIYGINKIINSNIKMKSLNANNLINKKYNIEKLSIDLKFFYINIINNKKEFRCIF